MSIPASFNSFGSRSCSVAEHPLRPAARLRRVGRDVLDAELLQAPADLRQHRLRHLAAGLRREEVMAAAVGVERAEQAVPRHHLAQPGKLDAVPSSSTRKAE